MYLSLATLSLAIASALSAPAADDVTSWLSQEIAHQSGVAYKGLFANIHPEGTAPGVVIASPSNQVNATDNNYWFHWKRE
jgi:hypothetical protein